MKILVKKILQEVTKYAYFIPPFQRLIDKQRQEKDLRSWQRGPRSLPLPHLLKQEILRGYASMYKLSVLVETGTYKGEMIAALHDLFEKVYSIELSEKYARRARVYFRTRKNVTILDGDSGEIIGELLKEIDQPALFWLDGHWSADETARGKKSTPIMEELDHILRGKGLRHVILIDDARAFGVSEDYPTMDELITFVHLLQKNVRIETEDDIIRILPQ